MPSPPSAVPTSAAEPPTLPRHSRTYVATPTPPIASPAGSPSLHGGPYWPTSSSPPLPSSEPAILAAGGGMFSRSAIDSSSRQHNTSALPYGHRQHHQPPSHNTASGPADSRRSRRQVRYQVVPPKIRPSLHAQPQRSPAREAQPIFRLDEELAASNSSSSHLSATLVAPVSSSHFGGNPPVSADADSSGRISDQSSSYGSTPGGSVDGASLYSGLSHPSYDDPLLHRSDPPVRSNGTKPIRIPGANSKRQHKPSASETQNPASERPATAADHALSPIRSPRSSAHTARTSNL